MSSNSYLVEDAAGVVIVDAGLPGQCREMQVELTRMGRSLDDVQGIVLTHGDTDHIGFAERLRRGNGVTVHVHELDAARARGEVKKPNSGCGRRSACDGRPPCGNSPSLSTPPRTPKTRHTPFPKAVLRSCRGAARPRADGSRARRGGGHTRRAPAFSRRGAAVFVAVPLPSIRLSQRAM